MIMRFRIGNTTNNNFYNNLRNFDNLLVEYQRGLIEIKKMFFFNTEISSEKCHEKHKHFNIFRFSVALLGAKALFRFLKKTKSA